jgi:hypothetical protein
MPLTNGFVDNDDCKALFIQLSIKQEYNDLYNVVQWSTISYYECHPLAVCDVIRSY